MSCFTIYYQDKEKRVRPIGSREEYLKRSEEHTSELQSQR